MAADQFSVKDKCIAITGAAGVLCGRMAAAMASAGARVAVLDFDIEGAERVCSEIGDSALAVKCDVLKTDEVEAALASCLDSMGRVDVLVNGARGNSKGATCAPPETYFGLDEDAIRRVFELNCMGTMIPCRVFGKHMAERGDGVIVNISSMSALQPLTRISAYSAAKAAVSNFTLWLSTYMCQNHSPNIRVNAIAPGFFLTEQNRFLLTNEDGSPTDRGGQIIGHTPMGRFGEPDELIGTLQWLISDASKFVTGIVVPVDGGFSAYSGV